MYIKIADVEAFSEVKMALHLNADGIIIPMVESEFALTKSLNMIEDLLGKDCGDFDVYINIETKTAVENLDKILSSMNSYIKGITIGRSDLSYSYGKKGEQDSAFINHEVEKIVNIAISQNVKKITIGGGISKKTFNNFRITTTFIFIRVCLFRTAKLLNLFYKLSAIKMIFKILTIFILLWSYEFLPKGHIEFSTLKIIPV